jgi:hypothetical protein
VNGDSTGKKEKKTVVATVRMNERQCAIEFKRMCGARMGDSTGQNEKKDSGWFVRKQSMK